MKTNPLLTERWYEQLQIRKLIWESEARFWVWLSKSGLTRKKRYVRNNRWK